jgi:hypothetical protein
MEKKSFTTGVSQFGSTGKINIFGNWGGEILRKYGDTREPYEIELKDESVRDYEFKGITKSSKLPDPLPI